MFALMAFGSGNVLAFGLDFSPWQLFLILVIVLLLFGGRVPEVMRNLGRGVSEFKKGMRSLEEEMNAPQPQQYQQPYQQAPQPQLQQPVYRAPVGPAGQDPRVAQGPYDQQPMQQGYPAQAQYAQQPQQPMQPPGQQPPYPQQPYPQQPQQH